MSGNGAFPNVGQMGYTRKPSFAVTSMRHFHVGGFVESELTSVGTRRESSSLAPACRVCAGHSRYVPEWSLTASAHHLHLDMTEFVLCRPPSSILLSCIRPHGFRHAS
jgi:hypothetical protein